MELTDWLKGGKFNIRPQTCVRSGVRIKPNFHESFNSLMFLGKKVESVLLNSVVSSFLFICQIVSRNIFLVFFIYFLSTFLFAQEVFDKRTDDAVLVSYMRKNFLQKTNKSSNSRGVLLEIKFMLEL